MSSPAVAPAKGGVVCPFIPHRPLQHTGSGRVSLPNGGETPSFLAARARSRQHVRDHQHADRTLAFSRAVADLRAQYGSSFEP